MTLIGAAIVAWAALKQARTASERHQEQTKADRERRITESFSKAIEQLGSDKREVRLGGIYTLERLSHESEREYWPIMETLTAYVREHAQWVPCKVLPSKIILPTFSNGLREKEGHIPTSEASMEAPELGNASEQGKNTKHKPATDIQAVLTVLGRRSEYARKQDEAKNRRLDLANTDLRGADLTEAHLERANLMGAYLEGADLVEAHLEGAYLWKAHLKGADLRKAYLEGADLVEAHLEGAYLWKAHLERADLREAIDLTQTQLFSAKGDEYTHLPEGLTRPVHWHEQKDQR
jgi:hypothetical protein